MEYSNEKPLPGVQINWSSPLSKNIEACWLLNEQGQRAFDLSGHGRHMNLTNGFSSPPKPPRSTEGITFVNANSTYMMRGPTEKVVDVYPFTLSAWFKISSATGGVIFSIAKSTVDNVYWGIAMTSDGNGQLFSRNTTNYVTQDTINWKNNQWHNITGVFYQSYKRYLYIDGINTATSTDAQNTVWSNEVDRYAIGVGARSTLFNYFDGVLRQVVVWGRRALSTYEVKYYVNHPQCLFI